MRIQNEAKDKAWTEMIQLEGKIKIECAIKATKMLRLGKCFFLVNIMPKSH